MEVFLLILYAEAARLGAAKTALHKLQAPWGICVELDLKALLLLLLCFANGERRGGEEAARCCRVSVVPGFCLAQQWGPTESISLHLRRPPPLQLPRLSEHAMP